MNLQDRKMALFIIAFAILNSQLVGAFEYDTSSLREEITEISIHMFLEEGYYHLVIDNTGYLSGDYDREDTLVELEIFAIDGVPEYTTDTRNLKPQYYWDIPISTDTFLFLAIHFVFNITATNPVTVFLTDEDGFIDFQEEIQNFEFREPISAFLIIGIVLGSIIVLGISAGLIERVRNKNGLKKPEMPDRSEEGEKEIKLGKTKIVVYYCEQCNEEYVNKAKTCSKCGNKLEKTNKRLEEM